MIGVGVPASRAPRVAAAISRASERDHWIALSLVPGIGPATFTQLVLRHGSATEAWRAGPAGLRDVTRVADQATSGFADMQAQDPRLLARAIERATERAGGVVATVLDERYPPALLSLDPRPPTLYLAGDRDAFRHRAVAVVGTRRASGYGLSVAAELGDELARAGVVLVSGLALGIDGAAHRAAVEAGGRSIAVLPSPLDRVYPPRHRSLARQLVEAGGALVSEVPIGAAVGKPDFARRNRLIAGLSEAVVVVEAPDHSGALLTASAATAIGRELYAVPGAIGAMTSRGCNRLIADQQAAIVTSTAALLRQIGLSRSAPPPVASSLSEVEGQLLRRLLERAASVEELVDLTGHPAAAVASALTMLEARGLVNSYGGATFHPTITARGLGGAV